MNVCICVKLKATRKLLTGESKHIFLTDLKRKRNAQITVCYDVERRKIQVSMYKQIINLSSPCHVFLSVRTISFCFYDLLMLFSRTRMEKRSIRHELYFITRIDRTGTCNRRVREPLEEQGRIGLIIEMPSDEESHRERS